MSDPSSDFYERRLQRAIEEIEAKLKELTGEKLALQRQLQKAREETARLPDVNRKNSIVRVMIETRILEALRESPEPLPSRRLFVEARYVAFELPEATFRTHLHRMKKRGLIESTGERGWWRLGSA